MDKRRAMCSKVLVRQWKAWISRASEWTGRQGRQGRKMNGGNGRMMKRQTALYGGVRFKDLRMDRDAGVLGVLVLVSWEGCMHAWMDA